MTPQPDGGERNAHAARRLVVGLLLGWLASIPGCSWSALSGAAPLDVYGQWGLLPGEFVKPRAVALDRAAYRATSDDDSFEPRVYLVDMRAVIQAFSTQGEPLLWWETPTHELGRPSGLAVDRSGNLVVADSHYHQLLFYTPQGELLGRLAGEEGTGPLVGRFGYIADVAVDSQGNLYVAEAQQHERISKITPQGELLGEWGGRGPEPGQFQRIRGMDFDLQDRLYVADACNHRIQVFDTDGTLVRVLGELGDGPGQLSYPYDVALAPDGTIVVCEYGNHRVQRFDLEGESLGTWGSAGRGPGQLWNPWAVAVDDAGVVHVVDSNNHRVQRVRF